MLSYNNLKINQLINLLTKVILMLVKFKINKIKKVKNFIKQIIKKKKIIVFLMILMKNIKLMILMI
jgi:hypothetical protein